MEILANMSLKDSFNQALVNVKSLTDLGNDELLHLYALYKQATVGEVSGKKPGMLDFKGRAKYEAWEKQKGLSQEAAMEKYVTLVKKLK